MYLNLVTLCATVYPPTYATIRYKVHRESVTVIQYRRTQSRVGDSAVWVDRRDVALNWGHQVRRDKFPYHLAAVDLLPETTSVFTLIG